MKVVHSPQKAEPSAIMLRLVVLLAVLICALGAPRTHLARPRYAPGSRIVGGTEVTIDQAPFQLSWEENWSYICGASLVSRTWVVSAGHCAEGSNVNQVRVRAGTDILEEGGQLHLAAEIIIHPNYDSFSIDYDVSILRVYEPFTMGPTTAGILLTRSEPLAGDIATVSGWGTTSSGNGTLSKNLRMVKVPITTREYCNDAYANYGGITERMICAGLEEGGMDSCQGDSGGPLWVNSRLAGIVSWGMGCALPGYPGVYTNVDSVREWIQENSDANS